jgi:hypothetical protein
MYGTYKSKTHRGEGYAQNILAGKFKRKHGTHLRINGRVILKLILHKEKERMRYELVSTGSEHGVHDRKHLYFIIIMNFFYTLLQEDLAL